VALKTPGLLPGFSFAATGLAQVPHGASEHVVIHRCALNKQKSFAAQSRQFID